MTSDKTERRRNQSKYSSDGKDNETIRVFRRKLLRALDDQFRSAPELIMERDLPPFPELIERSLAFCEYFGWAEEQGVGETLRWRRGPMHSMIEKIMEDTENKDKYTHDPAE